MVKIDHIELPDFPLLLAPMEDVSDPPFRVVCKQNGADLLYTEFISSEGLVREKSKCTQRLVIFEEERPVGIQLFGGNEDQLALASRIVDTAGPDFLDINFGCPVKGIVTRGAGAGVLKDIDRMVKLTAACIKATRLPVTVKTRLGWDDDTKNIVEVAERLQDIGVKALSIHGRTRCQLYKGQADWSLIGEVKNNPRMHIPIFGNGDIDSPEKALAYRNRYGVDGIMIGRAAIGYPWLFREIKHYMATGEHHAPPSIEERVAVCLLHLDRSMAWRGRVMGINIVRRHYAKYLQGLPEVREFTRKLVTLNTREEIVAVLTGLTRHYAGYEMPRTPIELINYHEHCAL